MVYFCGYLVEVCLVLKDVVRMYLVVVLGFLRKEYDICCEDWVLEEVYMVVNMVDCDLLESLDD